MLISMVAVVLVSLTLLWSQRNLFPLQNSGRSKLLYTISGVFTLTAISIPIAELRGAYHSDRNCFELLSKWYVGGIILSEAIAPSAVFIPLLIAYRSYMREWNIHMLLQKIAKPLESIPRTRSRNKSVGGSSEVC